MPVRFEHPEWLWVAAASLPMAWLGLRWFLTMSRVRRWSAVLARAFLLASLASLLAGAVSVRRTDRLAVVAVIDVSDSVRRFATGPDDTRPDILPAVRDFLADASARRGPDDLLGVVAFDRRALAIATPSRADPLTRPIDVRMGEGTDIEAALRYASAMIPADAAGAHRPVQRRQRDRRQARRRRRGSWWPGSPGPAGTGPACRSMWSRWATR